MQGNTQQLNDTLDMKVLKKVLLIDDDYATNYLHELFLEESGRTEEILVAKSVDEALDIIRKCVEEKSMPEIIFLDINLPARNGWEFIEEYESMINDRNLESLVVMLSTSENPKDLEKSKDYKLIKEYKIKPLSVEIINELVDKYFE